MPVDPRSFLFITLDSCRYDTFEAAQAPNLKRIGRLHRAFAPGNFTYASHAAMFVGFTPGVPGLREPYANPKYGKIWRLNGYLGKEPPFVALSGRNLMHGFKALGYQVFGTGALGWFDPASPTTHALRDGFDSFFYPKTLDGVGLQLDWCREQLSRASGAPVFLFVNIGETHVPYHYQGADWSPEDNPCVPYGSRNDAEVCRRRQLACVEFVDRQLAGLLGQFEQGNTIVCADHGDAWGEDGIWEHGVHHPKVLEVPLLYRLNRSPTPG